MNMIRPTRLGRVRTLTSRIVFHLQVGVLSTFLCGVRCAARFSKFWPYFRSKMHLISFHTRFQTWPLRNDVIIEKLMKEMKSFLILFMSYKTSLGEHFSSLTVYIMLDPTPSPTPTPSGDLWSQNWCKSWSMIPWTFFDPWIQSGVDQLRILDKTEWIQNVWAYCMGHILAKLTPINYRSCLRRISWFQTKFMFLNGSPFS